MADMKEKKESLISQYRKLNPEEQKYIRGICWKVVISFVVALAVAIWLDFFSGETGICQDTSKKLVRSLFIPEEPQQGLCPYASLPQDIFLT